MPRFAANLSMLFTDAPLVDRIDRAAKAGFDAVEVQFPYEVPAATLRDRLEASGIPMVLHNLPAGDWAAGDRGIACDPARQSEFRDGIARAIDYAQALGVRQINCLTGKPGASVSDVDTHATLIGNLGHAAERLAKADLRLLLEPVNTLDVPGFWLNSVDKALSIMDEVAAPNLFLQFDIYHAQRTEGEICATLSKHLPRIAHIQTAANPGRHEPGTGELDDAFVFAHLDKLGYSGWIGCEYKPATSTEAGLGWLQTVGKPAAA
jgi:hydroxypyruvate isomerase